MLKKHRFGHIRINPYGYPSHIKVRDPEIFAYLRKKDLPRTRNYFWVPYNIYLAHQRIQHKKKISYIELEWWKEKNKILPRMTVEQQLEFYDEIFNKNMVEGILQNWHKWNRQNPFIYRK